LPESFHGRRGSAVRVRQRALQKRRKSALCLLSAFAGSPVCSGYGAPYRAFRFRAPLRSVKKWANSPEGWSRAAYMSTSHEVASLLLRSGGGAASRARREPEVSVSAARASLAQHPPGVTQPRARGQRSLARRQGLRARPLQSDGCGAGVSRRTGSRRSRGRCRRHAGEELVLPGAARPRAVSLPDWSSAQVVRMAADAVGRSARSRKGLRAGAAALRERGGAELFFDAPQGRSINSSDGFYIPIAWRRPLD
jgi:hypothetical protein